MRALPVVVVASANPHKVAEMTGLLAGVVEVHERPSDIGDIEENATTLEANAAHKAVTVARHAGASALADDTGLEVDALGGAPGVRSARYAGEAATDADNRRLLLDRLRGVSHRDARFRTVLALAAPDGTVRLFEGACEGTIAKQERGHNGFGYDPVFVPVDGDGRTFAEMTPADKDALSHRAKAVRAFTEWLAAQPGPGL